MAVNYGGICFLDLIEAAPLAAGRFVDVPASGSLIEFVTTTIALFRLGIAVADAAFADPPGADFTRYPFVVGIPVVGKTAF